MNRLYLKNKTLTQIVKEQCWISRSSEGYNATCWWKGLDPALAALCVSMK